MKSMLMVVGVTVMNAPEAPTAVIGALTLAGLGLDPDGSLVCGAKMTTGNSGEGRSLNADVDYTPYSGSTENEPTRHVGEIKRRIYERLHAWSSDRGVRARP